MDEEQQRAWEALNTLAAAQSMFELYSNFIVAGFTEEQAFELIKTMLSSKP